MRIRIEIFLFFGVIAIMIAIMIVALNLPEEQFVEVYFENFTHLPRVANLNKSYNLSVAVVSHSDQKRYTYTLRIGELNSTSKLYLRKGDKKNIDFVFYPQNLPFEKRRVAFQLEPGGQEIYFHYRLNKTKKKPRKG